jgi:hypothetical protein
LILELITIIPHLEAVLGPASKLQADMLLLTTTGIPTAPTRFRVLTL